MTEYKPIVESENYIILDKYEKDMSLRESLAVYQTEASLEREFIEDLKRQLNCEKNIFKTPIAPNGLYLARIFYKWENWFF